MKNDFGKFKDLKLALKANLAWWSVFFCCLLPLFLVFLQGSLLLRVLLAAVIAVQLDLLLIYGIFPRVNKQNAIYKNILLALQRDGYSPEVLANMETQLRWCQQNSSTYAVYRNSYALYLTDGYSSLHEYEKARQFLTEVDVQALFRDGDTSSARRQIALYHTLKTILAAASGDKALTESSLREMEAQLASGKVESLTINRLLDIARFEWHYLNERYAECEACMRKYMEYEELKWDVSIFLARCYWKTGRTQEADALIASLEPLIRNDWMRRSIELDCAKFRQASS